MLIKASKRAKYEKGEEKIVERTLVVYRNAIMRLNSVARKCCNSKPTLTRRIDGTDVIGAHKKNSTELLISKTKFKVINIFHHVTKHTLCFHYYLF